MIRWVTTGARIGLVVAAMAVIVPMVTFAQTSSPATESEPAASGHASPVQAASGPEDNTSVETNLPARSTIPSEVGAENQRLINELRSELLDDRADYIDRWLIAVSIVLAFFGILGFKRFREIEAEARKSVEAAKRYEADAKDHAERIEALQGKAVADAQRIRELTAEAAAKNPAEAHQAVKNTRENPKASLIDKAIANALNLQQQGRNKEAIKKWRGLARVAEGSDNDLAAWAWLSVGYLALGEDPKGSVLANDRAIRLKPDLGGAYINRGNAKQKLEQYEAAIVDYDEAIHLNPTLVEAYINRGDAKAGLKQYEAAITDYNEAIRLKPDYAEAYINRGAAKYELGRHEAAGADYDEAIRLNPDYAEAYSKRGEAKQKLRQYEAAVDDCNEAIRLKPNYAEAYNNRGISKGKLGLIDEARNANNAKIVTQAERLLRDLDAAEGS